MSLDFNNDALYLIAASLRPLVGAEVRVYGCFADGRDYTYGTLVYVDASSEGAYIGVGNPERGVERLHAFQEAHRVLVDQ
jgi:hypothetical protein